MSENIEKLENRCEELQRLLDEARNLLEKQQNQQRRRRERRKSSQQRYNNSEAVGGHDYGSKMSEESEAEADKNSTTSEENESSEELRCRTQESGYSSGSIESHLHRLDSDSEMSSPDREKDPQKSIEEELILDTLRNDKIEIEERLQEMEKVVHSLQSENQRLQSLFSSANSETSVDSYKSVDDEVQDIHDVR